MDKQNLELLTAVANAILEDDAVSTTGRGINFQNKEGTDYCYCYIDDEGNLVGDIDEFRDLFTE